MSAEVPSFGQRRAVATFHFGLAGDIEPPSPPSNLYETGPWALQEWNGMEWLTVGHATTQRTRNRFVKGHQASKPNTDRVGD